MICCLRASIRSRMLRGTLSLVVPRATPLFFRLKTASVPPSKVLSRAALTVS
jgi:hypothetical protein